MGVPSLATETSGFNWAAVVAAGLTASATIVGAFLTARWSRKPSKPVEAAVDAAFAPVEAASHLLLHPTVIEVLAVGYAFKIGGPIAAKQVHDALTAGPGVETGRPAATASDGASVDDDPQEPGSNSQGSDLRSSPRRS